MNVPATLRSRFVRNGPFPPNPFDDFSIEDSMLYAIPDGAIVHSSRLPVGNDVPWLAEQDCLLATLQWGQLFACGSERAILARDVDTSLQRLRARSMLVRFVDPRCEAIVFWTEYARSSSLRRIESAGLLDARDIARLAAKSDVIYPAVAPLVTSAGRDPENPVCVLFAGRTFADKGGALALAVFQELSRRYGSRVRLILVGDVPPDNPLPPNVLTVRPRLSRDEFMSLLAKGDIFFSPTLYESPGMALIEAAAAGMAVVTSFGTGMEHVRELFTDGVHGYLVSNDETYEHRVEQYTAALGKLIDDSAKRRAMGEANLRLVGTGKLSLSRHNDALLSHYERMWNAPPSNKATLAATPWNESVWGSFSDEYLRMELVSRTRGRAHRTLVPSSF